MGRIISSLLVGYVNIQGAWLIAGILAATGLYFASAVSFRDLMESVAERWIHFQAFHDRYRNWREERAERKAEALAQLEAEQPDLAETAELKKAHSTAPPPKTFPPSSAPPCPAPRIKLPRSPLIDRASGSTPPANSPTLNPAPQFSAPDPSDLKQCRPL